MTLTGFQLLKMNLLLEGIVGNFEFKKSKIAKVDLSNNKTEK